MHLQIQTKCIKKRQVRLLAISARQRDFKSAVEIFILWDLCTAIFNNPSIFSAEVRKSEFNENQRKTTKRKDSNRAKEVST